VKTVRSEFATDNDQAEQIARQILARVLGPSDEVSFKALVNPALEDLDTVAFTRTVMGLSTERMLITHLEIPLTPETEMTGRARRSILIDGTGAPGRT
jgi:hypothetical protein